MTINRLTKSDVKLKLRLTVSHQQCHLTKSHIEAQRKISIKQISTRTLKKLQISSVATSVSDVVNNRTESIDSDIAQQNT